MSEKQINVAIIGLGFGAEFIPIYQAHPDEAESDVHLGKLPLARTHVDGVIMHGMQGRRRR